MQRNTLNSSKIKILICCHKPCELPKDDIFLPIQVGASISNLNLGIQRDDQINGKTCDNISIKNKSFCELTALYWAWKNIKKLYPDIEYIGLNHYRRYFDFNKLIFKQDSYVKPENQIPLYKINKSKLKFLLKHNYSIIPNRSTLSFSLENQYCLAHISDDIRELRKTVKQLYPSYNFSYEYVMTNSNLFSPYNMFILSWNDFNNYCEWLFTILFELEKKINITYYSDSNKRIFGYMAERLFNVWIFHNKLKRHYLPVLFFGNSTKKNYLKYLYKLYQSNLAFYFSLPLLKMKIKRILFH